MLEKKKRKSRKVDYPTAVRMKEGRVRKEILRSLRLGGSYTCPELCVRVNELMRTSYLDERDCLSMLLKLEDQKVVVRVETPDRKIAWARTFV